jgi:hypothetical protein
MIEELKKLFAPKPTSNMSGFQFSDLFDNNRWETRKKAMEDVAPKRQGDDVYYRQYMPRKDVTEKETIGDDGRRTKTIVSKFIDPGETYGFPLNDRQFRPDDGMGANSSYSPPSLPYERLADINKSRFTPGRFMPSTFAEEGPAMASYAPPTMRGTYDEEGPGMASYAPPTMRNQFAEEGPGMGSYAPWSDRAGARPPMERGPYSMRGSFAEDGPGQRSIPQSYGPAGQIAHRMQPSGYRRPVRQTSATTYPYNMVPQADVGLIPISTQNTPQPTRVPLSYNQQSQLDRFPYSGMAPMSDADKMRMLELLLLERND